MLSTLYSSLKAMPLVLGTTLTAPAPSLPESISDGIQVVDTFVGFGSTLTEDLNNLISPRSIVPQAVGGDDFVDHAAFRSDRDRAVPPPNQYGWKDITFGFGLLGLFVLVTGYSIRSEMGSNQKAS